MYDHSERLQRDLDSVRAFAATASDDDRLALAEVLSAMSFNLPKAKRCEDKCLAIADLNAWLQAEADRFGVPFAPVPNAQSVEVLPKP